MVIEQDDPDDWAYREEGDELDEPGCPGRVPPSPLVKKPTLFEDHPVKIHKDPKAFKNSFNNLGPSTTLTDRFLIRK